MELPHIIMAFPLICWEMKTLLINAVLRGSALKRQPAFHFHFYLAFFNVFLIQGVFLVMTKNAFVPDECVYSVNTYSLSPQGVSKVSERAPEQSKQAKRAYRSQCCGASERCERTNVTSLLKKRGCLGLETPSYLSTELTNVSPLFTVWFIKRAASQRLCAIGCSASFCPLILPLFFPLVCYWK